MNINNDLIVLDLETTGTWIEKDKIVEIALIKILKTGEKIIYHKKINPEMPIPPFVSELIGITNNDIKDSPIFKNVVNDVLSFVEGCDFGGFNVHRFDLPLLEREINECGLEFKWRERDVFDAQKVFHINEKRDLSAAYEFYCHKKLENAHSALVDAEATLTVLEGQVKEYCSESLTLDGLKEFDYKVTSEFYDSERKFRWWNGKLYMMFGKYARKYNLQEVVQKDPKYLEWILSANFSEEIKKLIENALKGVFPKLTSHNDEKSQKDGSQGILF